MDATEVISTHYRCNRCKVIDRVEHLENKPWYGWNIKGETIPVNNWCCPHCGSNDIIYRAPGVDQ